MKHYYKNEALFSDTKIVTSVYGHSFDGTLDSTMIDKLKFDDIPHEAIQELEVPNYESLIKTAVRNSDAVIIASENVSADLTKFIEASGVSFLPFVPKEKFAETYTEFYKKMLP
jgi:starch synthase